MYNKEFPSYIIQAQLDGHPICQKIIDLVPNDGCLEMSSEEIAHTIGESLKDTQSAIDLMSQHKVALIQQTSAGYLCDYKEKDIEYVKHFRRALSNFSLTQE